MPNMKEAIAAALADGEDTADQSAEVTPDETTDAPAEDSTEDSTDTTEGTGDAATGDEPEAPETYFGVDLTGLSKEDAAAIVAGFTERDKYIQQLLRNKPEDAADDAKDDTKPPAPADEEEVTDAAILQALGLDDVEDNPYAEKAAKAAVPLAKLVLSLQEEVTTLRERGELDALERHWTTTLTGLESKFGKLPATHEEVMQQAAAAEVGDPTDAFWRIMGPARQEVMSKVNERQAALAKSLKDGAKGSVRPKDETAGSEKPIEGQDVKTATKTALAALFKERGIALEDTE